MGKLRLERLRDLPKVKCPTGRERLARHSIVRNGACVSLLLTWGSKLELIPGEQFRL
jgi:hypothetical protein